MKLLDAVMERVREKGYRVGNADVTIVAQRPKLAPYFPQAIQNIAEDLNVQPDQVSLKATTTEGMNDEGKGLCISAQAIANLI